ncbi:serine hydrolase [Lewinella sp. IMCC34183]|uniref:serine hydrolase n=1 Tax=Lewinella sp. IMCC34183 TaxID=2248762 RepID=UPI000E2665B4|nr:serine hydrolase [Lewinella sp. IMCC34183]
MPQLLPLLIVLLTVLTAPTCLVAQSSPLDGVIESIRDSIPWVDSPQQYQIEVLYTRIDRLPGGEVKLTTFHWGDSTDYYYPASTVKLPVAVLALQRLNELGVIGMDSHTPMYHGAGTAPASAPQTPVDRDTSSANGLPSVGHYVRKIFLTSDNDAYNRLFEWLGPTYINNSLQQVGITGGRILHRVGVGGFDTLSHRYLNPVRFAAGYESLYQIGERYDDYYDPLPGITGQRRGVGYTAGDSLVNEPFDFSHKNYLSLRNLHDILLRVVVPGAVADPFRLTDADYALLRRAMAERPRESDFPRYDKPDNYVKFWIYGDRPEDYRIPDNVRILNKVGWAYGYLTDVAYITDGEVEFILAGRIHTNANGIYNDGVYEYEEIGMPFFGRLGRAMLALERRRPR